jgi:hypothetical protein
VKRRKPDRSAHVSRERDFLPRRITGTRVLYSNDRVMDYFSLLMQHHVGRVQVE